jgi:hypothetical protein
MAQLKAHPSNFTSTAHPAPAGIGALRASIGSTKRGSCSREDTPPE